MEIAPLPPISFAKASAELLSETQTMPAPSTFAAALGTAGDQIRAQETAFQAALSKTDNPMETMETVLKTRAMLDFVRAMVKTSLATVHQIMQTPV